MVHSQFLSGCSAAALVQAVWEHGRAEIWSVSLVASPLPGWG